MLSWAVQRDIFYTERDRIRKEFEANLHLKDLGVVEKCIADGEAKLAACGQLLQYLSSMRKVENGTLSAPIEAQKLGKIGSTQHRIKSPAAVQRERHVVPSSATARSVPDVGSDIPNGAGESTHAVRRWPAAIDPTARVLQVCQPILIGLGCC